jgi:hypothetical protein
MFKLSVPSRILERHPEAQTVLDPFCGRGTTLYAARLGGKRGIGIDLNPVAAAISRAKIAKVDRHRVSTTLDRALAQVPKDVPEGEFWERCFHPETLAAICSIREFLRFGRGNAAALLRAAMLGLLHGPQTGVGSYLSNQMPRTYATKPDAALRYWRKHKMRPRRVDVHALVKRRLDYLLAAVPPAAGGQVFCANALSLLPRLDVNADLVITSPPYMGLRTYLPDQWLRLWFLGGPPKVEYRLLGQIGVESEKRFTEHLASFLRGINAATSKKAHAYVLLGSIPSTPANVPALMKVALEDSPWHVVSRRSQGQADAGKRQAAQFARSAPAEEYLYHLVKGS